MPSKTHLMLQLLEFASLPRDHYTFMCVERHVHVANSGGKTPENLWKKKTDSIPYEPE